MKTKLISIIAIILVISTYTISTFASTTDELNQQKQELNQKKEDATNQLKNITSDKSNAESDLDTINDQINSLNDEISALNIELNDLNTAISAKEDEIANKEKELKEKEELLKKRMVALYKGGGTSYLDVLLGSNNYLDMLSSYDVVSEIADADTKLMNQISEEKTSLESSKKELEEQKTSVQTKKESKDSKSNELKVAQSDRQAKIAKLSEAEKATQAEIKETKDAIDRVQQKLTDIADDAKKKLSENGTQFDGSFIWPCNNKTVVSTVKLRWGRMHKGIDIAANYESVYASASGFAYSAYDANGYGNYIMIFHGNNYVTLYAHLSAVKITYGSYVAQGQVIATSGGAKGSAGSGDSQGAHLHFELRQASSKSDYFLKDPLNPLKFLPGGYTLAAGA